MATNSTPYNPNGAGPAGPANVDNPERVLNPVDDGSGNGPRPSVYISPDSAPKGQNNPGAVSRPFGDGLPETIDLTGAPPTGADDTIALYEDSQGVAADDASHTFMLDYFAWQELQDQFALISAREGATSGDVGTNSTENAKQVGKAIAKGIDYANASTAEVAVKSEVTPVIDRDCKVLNGEVINLKNGDDGGIVSVPQTRFCNLTEFNAWKNKGGGSRLEDPDQSTSGGWVESMLDLSSLLGSSGIGSGDVGLGHIDALMGTKYTDAFAALGFVLPEKHIKEIGEITNGDGTGSLGGGQTTDKAPASSQNHSNASIGVNEFEDLIEHINFGGLDPKAVQELQDIIDTNWMPETMELVETGALADWLGHYVPETNIEPLLQHYSKWSDYEFIA